MEPFKIIATAIVFAACLPCNGRADANDETAQISIAEAKAAIIRFLETSRVARESAWIRASLPIVKRTEMTAFADSGIYACGPWQVDPRSGEAKLTSDRAQLIATFAKREGKWIVTNTKIIAIRK